MGKGEGERGRGELQVHLRGGFLGEGFAGHEDGEEGKEEGGVLHFGIRLVSRFVMVGGKLLDEALWL